jgi:hypothetical protein
MLVVRNDHDEGGVLAIIRKSINAFATLGVLAAFAATDVAIEGKALAQRAIEMPIGRGRVAILGRRPILGRHPLEGTVRVGEEKAAEPVKRTPTEPRTTFEWWSGKYKNDSSWTMGGVNVTGGEANLYDRVARIAKWSWGSAFVCLFVKGDLKTCVGALTAGAPSKDGKND